MSYDRAALIQLVRERALRFGQFTLSSGQTSSYYIDCRLVTLSSEGAALIGQAVLDQIDPSIQAVAGMSLGADPVVGATLTVAGEQGRPLRGGLIRKEAKDHGTGKQVEGPIQSGDRAIVVEDVTTTGSACVRSIEALRAIDVEVVGIVTVLDRLAGAAESFTQLGLSFTPLMTIRDLGIADSP